VPSPAIWLSCYVPLPAATAASKACADSPHCAGADRQGRGLCARHHSSFSCHPFPCASFPLLMCCPPPPMFMLPAPAARQGCASSRHCRSWRYKDGQHAAASMSTPSWPSLPCASSPCAFAPSPQVGMGAVMCTRAGAYWECCMRSPCDICIGQHVCIHAANMCVCGSRQLLIFDGCCTAKSLHGTSLSCVSQGAWHLPAIPPPPAMTDIVLTIFPCLFDLSQVLGSQPCLC
jgi:hypothetical protein